MVALVVLVANRCTGCSIVVLIAYLCMVMLVTV